MLAVDTRVIVTPDKAFYKPGEVVNLRVSAPSGGAVEADVRYLTQTVATISAPLVNGEAALTWTAPPEAPRGYGLDLRVLDAAGKVVANVSSAFDVLENWIQAPRYGFLSRFEAGRNDIAETMEWVSRYHVNGLQFYDWQYRHETLLPPTDNYADLLGKRMSLSVIRQLIDAGHEHNVAAMPYTAIYGASKGFYDQHPTWAMFQSPGEPYRFGDDFLIIMDPTPGSPWANHLLGEFAHVLDETAFDGIQIDQYGAPKVGLNSDGGQVKLEDSFPGFINEAVKVVQEKRGDDGAVIFNAVGNWPVDTVAPSDEDAVYIEIWQPYRNFMDLHKIVARAQELSGGKPVIIAAYIHPDRPVNVRLANALIYATGGYYLQFGEPGALLADPYFPKFGQMDDDLQAVMQQYADFMVRYENVLALNTTDMTNTRADALTIDGVKTKSLRSSERVATIVRSGDGFETFSLVNLLGLSDGHWDAPLAGAPTPVDHLKVQVQVSQSVKAVWMASPDVTDQSSQPVNFTTVGDSIAFELPHLDYWNMIVVEYQPS